MLSGSPRIRFVEVNFKWVGNVSLIMPFSGKSFIKLSSSFTVIVSKTYWIKGEI